VNKSSFFKSSLVCATVLVASGATIPQKLFAQDTGTVPVIKNHSDVALNNVKDNSTTPVFANPSTGSVTAPPPGGSPDDHTFTVEITVNAPTTVDTPLDLDTNHPEAVGLPDTVIVPAGSSTATFTVSVTPGYAEHHKHVKIYVSANGTTVTGHIKVHYHGEID
jgi:hypothetical protein